MIPGNPSRSLVHGLARGLDRQAPQVRMDQGEGGDLFAPEARLADPSRVVDAQAAARGFWRWLQLARVADCEPQRQDCGPGCDLVFFLLLGDELEGVTGKEAALAVVGELIPGGRT